MEVFVARQAIFDRQRQLYGYELLFRSGGVSNQFDGTEAGSATTQVIAGALLSIGLENLVRGKKAFLNFDQSLLLGGLHLSIPKESIVIEILETVEPDADLLAVCRSLCEQGYTIALDDFVSHARFEPLIDLAKLIKVDIRTTSKEEQERLLRIYKPRGITMLAEKVETYEEFEAAMRAGYDLFQGYFFARPVILRGRQIPAGKLTCMRLLREIAREELDFKKLEALIRQDVAFSYKLLRYTNSALFQSRAGVQSISHALSVVGESGIRRWVALAALPMMATDKPGELLALSLVRARFCERLAESAGSHSHNDALLMGMFSLLDTLVNKPLDEALREVNMGRAITEALLGTAPETDLLTNIYRLVRCYEVCDWDQVERLAQRCGVPPAAVKDAYLESTLWAEQVLHDSA
jgi:c-di-GMP-related signal transduction protein